jgi:hypothetical protein
MTVAHPTLHMPPSNALFLPQSIPKQSVPYGRAILAIFTSGPPRRPEQRRTGMWTHVLAFNLYVERFPTVRIKSKRELKEAVRLLVRRRCRGIALGSEIRVSPKRTPAPTNGLHMLCVVPGAFFGLAGALGACVLLTMCWSHTTWSYIVLPIAEMVWMTFAELFELMYQALGFVHRRRPEV